MRGDLQAFADLYRTLQKKRRWQLGLAMFLMLLGALAELLTIGAVLPFLAAIIGSGPAPGPTGLVTGLERLGAASIVGAATMLALAAFAAASVRLILLWHNQTLVAEIGNDLARALFERRLHMPLASQAESHSSVGFNLLEHVRRVSFSVLLPTMQGVIAGFLGLCVIVLLFIIDPAAAAIGSAALGAIYFLLAAVTRRRLAKISRVNSRTTAERHRLMTETSGGIRYILLEGAQQGMTDRFAAADRSHRHAQAMIAVLSQGPRFVLEAAGIAGLALAAVAMSFRSDGIAAAIPVIGAFALAAQRLLPLAQQVYQGVSNATGNFDSMREIVAALRQPLESQAQDFPAKPIEFREIVADELGYRHPDGRFALEGISFRLKSGQHLAITGSTGSGKSTLLDLLMGLLEPSSGQLLVDGRSLEPFSRRAAWQASLAHVPQEVFLTDDSIRANIAFPLGPDRVDKRVLERALELAQLTEFVAGLPEGLATGVGERGVKLSGGQRQRIGIARALVRRPRLLILDEATSSLDTATEQKVLKALLAEPGLSIISVSHDEGAVEPSDLILRLSEGCMAGPRPDRHQVCAYR